LDIGEGDLVGDDEEIQLIPQTPLAQMDMNGTSIEPTQVFTPIDDDHGNLDTGMFLINGITKELMTTSLNEPVLPTISGEDLMLDDIINADIADMDINTAIAG
jgi:hypothetical protein